MKKENIISSPKEIGIFVGRMCPIHKGHMKVIEYLIEKYGYNNSLIFIGSSNSSLSFRNLFSYHDRAKWIKILFPLVHIVGLPDSPGNDDEWDYMLNDYIETIFPFEKNVTFIGGSPTDVKFFYDYGRNVHILDRNQLHCSGTNIRQLLLQEDDVSKFIDQKIIEDVKTIFRKRLKEFDESK